MLASFKSIIFVDYLDDLSMGVICCTSFILVEEFFNICSVKNAYGRFVPFYFHTISCESIKDIICI